MTDKSPESDVDCKTIPMRFLHSRAACPSSLGSNPSTRTLPESLVRKPSRISTVVVFPAPFGPSKANISPDAMDKSIPLTAWTWP